MKLFTIQNKQLSHYNPPFVSNTEQDAIILVRNAIIGGRDISLVAELENLDLYCVGEFNAEEGTLIPYVNHKLIVNLEKIPLPETISKRLEALKDGKTFSAETEA